MRIELCDESRKRIGRIEVDPALRPTRASIVGSENGEKEVFLDWETALDDAGCLRRCIACGCDDLFRAKAFPQVTGVVVVLAFAGAVVGASGFATPPILGLMVLVLVADFAILLFSKQRLICHRCRSRYLGLPIARYHRRWDRSIADKHTQSTQEQEQTPPPIRPAPSRTNIQRTPRRASSKGQQIA